MSHRVRNSSAILYLRKFETFWKKDILIIRHFVNKKMEELEIFWKQDILKMGHGKWDICQNETFGKMRQFGYVNFENEKSESFWYQNNLISSTRPMQPLSIITFV